MVQKVIYTNSW